MDNSLARIIESGVRPTRQNRDAVTKGNEVFNAVRLSGLKAEGVTALAAKSMDIVAGLDEHRRQLAGENPVLDQMLAELELIAFGKVRTINSNLGNTFGL